MNSKNKIKLIISDLDGTLLDANSQLTNETIETVQDLRKAGYLFTFATGRLDRMAWHFAELLNLDLPIISCNGAMLRYHRSNELIYQYVLSYEAIEKIKVYCDAYQADYLFYAADKVYFSPNSKRIETFRRYNTQAKAFGHEEVFLQSLDTLENGIPREKIMKSFITFPPDKVLAEKLSHALLHIEDVDNVVSVSGAIDIVPTGCNKGEAVMKLASSLDLEMNQVCCIGDQMNDISMLERAGLAIAMGSGVKSVQEHADYIAGHHNENGMAQAMRKIFLS